MKKYIFAALLALGLLALVAPQPIFAQEEKPFTIHGEVRSRMEYTNNAADFDDNDGGAGRSTDQKTFFPYRFRIAAEGNFTHNVHAWIEFQQDGNWGENGVGNAFNTGFNNNFSSTNFNNFAEVYQANVTFDQLWSKNFSLRLGRQEIVAGNGLLLGNEEFYTGITHDGAVGHWNLKKVHVMVWYTRPFENMASFNSNQPPDLTAFSTTARDIDFLGGYATWTWKKDQIFDVYLMDLRDHSNGTSFGVGRPATIDTVGARFAHDTTTGDSFIWNIEIAQQFGDISNNAPGTTAGASFEGRAIEGWFGYNWKSGRNVHRIYGRVEQATGDKTDAAGNTGNKIEAFVPMFGDAHNRTGRGDWFRLANQSTTVGPNAVGTGVNGLDAWSVGYNGFYNDRHEFGAAYWNYKANENDPTLTKPVGKNLGKAIDVWYGFNYSRNVNFLASLSQLTPDDALTHANLAGVHPTDTVTRLYAQARLRF